MSHDIDHANESHDQMLSMTVNSFTPYHDESHTIVLKIQACYIYHSAYSTVEL